MNPLVQETIEKYLDNKELLLQEMTEDVREVFWELPQEMRRELARANPTVFAEQYIKPWAADWPDDSWMTDHHYLMYQATMESKRTIIHVPVDHSKSTNLTLIYPLWRLINNRNLRLVIFSNTARQAKKFGKRLRDNITGNPNLIRDFGDYLYKDKDGKWNDTEGHVVRDADQQSTDATYQFLGAGGSVNGSRIDLAILDDITDEESRKSQAKREDLEDWFVNTLLTRLTKDAKLLMIGTVQHRQDLLCMMSENKAFRYVKLSALDENRGLVLWPARYDMERLMEKKQEMGSEAFERQFKNNREAGTGGAFKREWIHYHGSAEDKKTPPYEFLKWFIACDPSTGIADDYTAIAIGAVSRENEVFLSEVIKEKLTPYNTVLRLEELYEMYKPHMIYVESIAYQYALVDLLNRSDAMMPIKPITHHASSKAERISSLAGHFEAGNRIWLNRNNCQPLVDEMLNYPEVENDDALDVVEMLVRSIRISKVKSPKGVSDLVKNMRLA